MILSGIWAVILNNKIIFEAITILGLAAGFYLFFRDKRKAEKSFNSQKDAFRDFIDTTCIYHPPDKQLFVVDHRFLTAQRIINKVKSKKEELLETNAEVKEKYVKKENIGRKAREFCSQDIASRYSDILPRDFLRALRLYLLTEDLRDENDRDFSYFRGELEGIKYSKILEKLASETDGIKRFLFPILADAKRLIPPKYNSEFREFLLKMTKELSEKKTVLAHVTKNHRFEYFENVTLNNLEKPTVDRVIIRGVGESVFSADRLSEICRNAGYSVENIFVELGSFQAVDEEESYDQVWYIVEDQPEKEFIGKVREWG